MITVNSKRTPFTFDSLEPESGLRAALGMSRADIITEVGACNLRGRGGAGFPTGLKWKFAAASKADQ
jgi:NADH:ubiquinone oxidoreductase subunit F (NADH-binding)